MKKMKSMQFDLSTSKRKYYALAFACLLVFTVGTLFTIRLLTPVQNNADTKAIKTVVLRAMAIPASIMVGNPARADITADQIPASSLKQTQADITLALTHTNALFKDTYATDCTKCQVMITKLKESLQAEANGQFHGLGGGLRDVEWRQISIDGSNASVTIAATVWSKYAYLNNGHVEMASPISGSVSVFSLAQFDGKWLITNMTSSSATNDPSFHQHRMFASIPSTSD